MTVNQSFVRDVFSVLKSRGIVIICGILTSIITARYIGPAGNGIIATLTVYPDLFMSVGSLGIRQSTTYFIGTKKYNDKDIVASVMYVWCLTTIFCVLICGLLLSYFTREHYSNWLIFLAVLPLPFSLFITYASGVFLGKNNIREFNRVNWVPNVMRLIGTLLFVVVIPLDVKGVMIGIIAGYFFLSFLVRIRLKKIAEISFKFNKDIIKGLLSLGLVYAISLLIINLNYKIDVVLLEKYSTNYQVGIYTKGVSVVQYLWEIPTLLSTIIFSRSATSKNPKEFSVKTCQLLRLSSIVILILSIIFYFLSSFIMVTMYGEKFYLSSTVQKILLPGILLLTVFKILNMDLAGKGKPWISMKAMVPSLLLNIVLNIMLNARYGANGAAVASTISYTVAAALFIYFYSKEVNIPVKQILTYTKGDFQVISMQFQKLKKINPL